MGPDTSVTPPAPVEGASGTTPESQATPSVPQGTETPQDAGQPKVEGQGQPTSSPATPRVKPSDFFNARKSQREVASLRQTVTELQKAIDLMTNKLSPGASPAATKRDYGKEIWDKPVDVINELIKDALNENVPKILDSRFSEAEQKKNRQEALELIFTNQRVAKDGDEGYERIVEILKAYGLDVVAQTDPTRAAKSALEIYGLKFPGVVTPPKPTNPLAPTNKGQMGTTQTGATTTTKKEANMDDHLTELRKLKDEVIKDPEKNYDPEFKKRIAEVKAKIAASQQTKP